jgi:two-component system, cell cycle sensor histidine kinase and response regulator CckA
VASASESSLLAGAKSADPAMAAGNGHIRILMLEDITTDAALAERELSAAGIVYESVRVESKDDFIRELHAFRPDIVLADFSLPRMTGLDALRLLQEEGADVPFILVTGTQNEEVAVDCMKAGADDYILKTSLKRLPSAVINALKKRQAEREKQRTQAILTESESQFRTLVNSIDEIVWSVEVRGDGLRGKLQFVSRQIKSILGYSPEDMLQNSDLWQSLIHPDDVAAVQDCIRRVIENKEIVTRSYRLHHKTKNEYRWLEDRVSPRLNDAGEVIGMFGVARDITERRLAEDAIRRSEELNHRILNTVPGGIVLVSMNGSILKANVEAQRILGLSYDELSRMFVSDFRYSTVYEDGSEFTVEDYPVSKCLRTGEPQSAVTLGTRRPDGTVAWCVFSAVPVHDPITGAMTGSVVTFLDITERKKAEEALRESRERFTTFMDNNPSVAFMKDDEWRYVYINRAFCVRFNTSINQISGRTDYELFGKDVGDELRKNDESVMRTGRVLQTFETVPTPDGQPHYWLSLKFPFLDASGKKFVGGIAIDVTERKRADEERLALERKMLDTQKLESLGVLAGGIAHDFNNLLAAVLGNVSLASMQMPPESPARPYLSSIETTTHRAAELCKQMLAYAGKGRFTVQQINLNTIIHEMAELLRISIGKRTDLKFELSRELPTIPADATQIRQVVMNLIINAAEAIGDGMGVVTLSTGVLKADRANLTSVYLAPELPEGEYLILEVTDNGCGMDAQTVAKIFDPFFSTKFTGRGLGLAAVLGIVRGHKGTIRVTSEPGKGTTFKILFPAGGQRQPAQESNSTLEMKKRTILIVDDDETLRTLQSRMLETVAFGSILAAGGEQALEILRTRLKDVSAVLLDLTMPGLGGEEVLRRIRRLAPELPVVLMSGLERADIGANDAKVRFLRKPFTTEQLKVVLLAALQ